MRFSNRYQVQEAAVAMPMRTAVIGLFPRGVVGAELTRVPARLPLWPEERAPVSRASDARAREFAAGRHCARSALGLLGLAPAGIPSLPSNAPAWPADTTGSLSHTAGYCGAVVAWRRRFAAVGFDVEGRGSVSPAVLAEIATEREVAMLARGSRHSVHELATVLFSAKESYYKAHHQAYGSELDFLDVVCRVVGPSTFEIAHRDRADSDHWSVARPGRFLVGERHVFTAIAWRPANDDMARVDP